MWENPSSSGITEVYFGLFTDPEEDCQPRKCALAIQEMTGSTTDLYAMGAEVFRRKA